MKVIKSAARWLALLALVASLASILMFRGLIFDGVRALQYQPSPITSHIAQEAKLNWLGKLYFYASSPVIDKTNRASAECGVEKSAAILGCYADGTIYVYNVDNQELSGIEGVTAAHEMLHAAYSRLSNDDRQRVDGLLTSELDMLKNDEAFSVRMKPYDRLGESERMDEIHSVIGTEVADISSELEAYYKRYFTDRGQVVSLYKGYSSVFFQLEAEVEQLAISYNLLVEERNDLVNGMNRRYDDLQARVASVETASQVTTSMAEAINLEIDNYNTSLVLVNRRLADYDKRLAKLEHEIEDSVTHQQQLNQAIDSSLAPAPQL